LEVDIQGDIIVIAMSTFILINLFFTPNNSMTFYVINFHFRYGLKTQKVIRKSKSLAKRWMTGRPVMR
jgi:hypothetical protein